MRVSNPEMKLHKNVSFDSPSELPYVLCQYCPDDAMPYSYSDWMLTDKPMSFGLIPGWANPTGIILIIVLTVMVICSMPQVRRSGHFEAFAWTHYVSCTTVLFQTDYVQCSAKGMLQVK